MAAAALEHAPKIKHWWLTTYGVVTSFLPIAQKNIIPMKNVASKSMDTCTSQGDNGEGPVCNKKAEFVHVGLFVNQKPGQVKVMDVRVRPFCPGCLYTSMTKALSKVVDPEFFRKSETNREEADPDSLFVVSEKAQFLQFCIEEVVDYMETYDPDTLQQLNEQLLEDQQ